MHRLHFLQREIVKYLLEHQDAKDTVEGIMHWWLPPGYASLRASDVREALEDLVQSGWLGALSHSQGIRVYGLDKSRQNEIVRWLEN